MPKFKLAIALAIAVSTIAGHAQNALAAELDSDPRSSLLILEATRDSNKASLETVKAQIADADAKLAHWQPLLENSSRLDEWMHSIEGRLSLRAFSHRRDSRSVRDALAMRVSAIVTQRDLLDSDARELVKAVHQNNEQIVRLKRNIELASSRANLARAARSTASTAKVARSGS